MRDAVIIDDVRTPIAIDIVNESGDLWTKR
jgi:hypothetical protein